MDRPAISRRRILRTGAAVVPLAIDTIASGGGGIHCATQSQSAVPAAT